MFRSMLVLVVSGSVHGANWASSCEVLSAQIESKIKAEGINTFALQTVDKDAAVDGKAVGTCGQGTKKIVYKKGEAGTALSPPPKSNGNLVVTECKDGSLAHNGKCK
jgi:hypothetical protein